MIEEGGLWLGGSREQATTLLQCMVLLDIRTYGLRRKGGGTSMADRECENEEVCSSMLHFGAAAAERQGRRITFTILPSSMYLI